MFADLVVDLLVAGVGLGAQAGGGKPRHHLAHEIIGVRDDRGDHDLARRQPERHPAGVVLDQDPDESLETAEDGAVQHHRVMLRTVLADIFGAKPHRQVEIGLEGAALPFPPDRIGQLEVKLRPVEGAFAGVDLIIVRHLADGVFQRGLGLVPDRVAAHPHRGPGRQLDVELRKSEIGVDRRQEPDEIGAFGLDLVLGAEDVGVILGETADPHQPVHRA